MDRSRLLFDYPSSYFVPVVCDIDVLWARIQNFVILPGLHNPKLWLRMHSVHVAHTKPLLQNELTDFPSVSPLHLIHIEDGQLTTFPEEERVQTHQLIHLLFEPQIYVFVRRRK